MTTETTEAQEFGVGQAVRSLGKSEYEYWEAQVKVTPCRTNRASALGFPCERHLVLARQRWQDRKPPDVGLQRIFGFGRVLEREIRNLLAQQGFSITHQEQTQEWKEFQVTGHIDGYIQGPGWPRPVLFEVKGYAGWAAVKIQSVQDLLTSSKPWHQSAAGQMCLYLFLEDVEEGLFAIVNKNSYECHYVPVRLDDEWLPGVTGWQYAESLLKKAERINAHVAADTLPDPTPEKSVCKVCDFLDICGVGLGQPGEVLEDPLLLEKLDRWVELQPSSKEFKQLDDQIKGQFKARKAGVYLVGDFQAVVKHSDFTRKAQEAKQGTSIRVTITQLVADKGQD